MKKIIITCFIIISLFVILSCKKESNEEIELYKNARYEYVEKLKLQIDQWNIQLDRLEINSSKFDGEVRNKVDKQLLTIQNQRDKLINNLEKIQNSTDKNWVKLKKNIDEDQDKINLAFFKAQSQF